VLSSLRGRLEGGGKGKEGSGYAVVGCGRGKGGGGGGPEDLLALQARAKRCCAGLTEKRRSSPVRGGQKWGDVVICQRGVTSVCRIVPGGVCGTGVGGLGGFLGCSCFGVMMGGGGGSGGEVLWWGESRSYD